MNQTIIGRQTLDDGRILEYGARDPNTGQRFERVINAPTQATSTVQQSTNQSSNLTAEQQKRYNELTGAGASESAALQAVNLIPTEISKTPDVPSQVSSPELPVPTATSVIDQYSQTLLQNEQNLRTQLEQKYQAELDRINKAREEAQKEKDALTAKTEGMITEDVKPLLEPFRADLEASERERLKVEENYFENQALVEELDSLLTQIQADVQATKDVTGLSSIREPRITKAVEDATARVGVIEAVMAARNNQINQAYTLIDRTLGAMTADRQDQLNYYNTLLNFYDKQTDEEGNKILSLDKEEKEIVNAQISLLENDLAQAQSNANYIKNLMINPDTAQFMAKAGITLNDTPDEVNRKMSEQSNRDQITEYKNSLVAQGYEYVPYPGNRTDLVSFEVGGQTLYFKAPVDSGGTTSFSDTQLNKGAVKAGMSIDEFSKLDEDTKNYFVNWDWDEAEKSIDDDFSNGIDLETEKSAINSMDVPDKVKETLIEYAENKYEEEYREPTFEETRNSLVAVAQGLKNQGIKKGDAEKEMQKMVKQQIAEAQGISSSKVDDIKLTQQQKDLIRASLYEVYGGSWNWNDVTWEEVQEKYYSE
jgi:hypothetical protein